MPEPEKHLFLRRSLRPSFRAGVSLVETVAILIVLSILAGVLAPMMSRTIEHARMTRVKQDEQAISKAILEFISDSGRQTFRTLPTDTSGQETLVQLLVSDGDIPSTGAGGASEWCRSVDFRTVDFLEYHLVTNNPGKEANNRYPVPTDFPTNPSAPCWRGAYMNAPIDSDPWGNRYAVNTAFLAIGSLSDVVVLSAGPDEEVDSLYDKDGFAPGDDDVTALVSPGSPSTVQGTLHQ